MRSTIARQPRLVAGVGGGKRQHGGVVAQLAAVIDIADRDRARRCRTEGGVVSGSGACHIAVLRERRGDLRLGELGRQPRHLRLIKIPQPVEIVGFRARQHVMGIGHCRQVADLGVLLADIIVKPGDRGLDHEIWRVLAVLLRADQKIGCVGVEPRHRIAAIAPHPKTAVGALQLDDMPDRAVERLRCRRPRIGSPQSRDVLDIEQGQGPAGRLLDAAVRIPFERAQQTRNVPIGPRADAEQSLGRARQEFVRRAVV